MNDIHDPTTLVQIYNADNILIVQGTHYSLRYINDHARRLINKGQHFRTRLWFIGPNLIVSFANGDCSVVTFESIKSAYAAVRKMLKRNPTKYADHRGLPLGQY